MIQALPQNKSPANEWAVLAAHIVGQHQEVHYVLVCRIQDFGQLDTVPLLGHVIRHHFHNLGCLSLTQLPAPPLGAPLPPRCLSPV